jgi:hypothetical protein
VDPVDTEDSDPDPQHCLRHEPFAASKLTIFLCEDNDVPIFKVKKLQTQSNDISWRTVIPYIIIFTNKMLQP